MGAILHKLGRLSERADPTGSSPAQTRATNLVEKTLKAIHLWPKALVGRELFYELRSPPPEFRGLRDLTARRGSSEEAAAICAVDAADPKLVAGRFAQGDLGVLGRARFDASSLTYGSIEGRRRSLRTSPTIRVGTSRPGRIGAMTRSASRKLDRAASSSRRFSLGYVRCFSNTAPRWSAVASSRQISGVHRLARTHGVSQTRDAFCFFSGGASRVCTGMERPVPAGCITV